MDEAQLVAGFKAVEVEYERHFKAVHDHFMPQAYEAAKAKDLERLRDLANRCPEHVAKCFILDQIRQLQLELDKPCVDCGRSLGNDRHGYLVCYFGG